MWIPKRMDPDRLDVKRAHADERPDGRTAELVSHIDYVELKLHEALLLLSSVENALVSTRFHNTDYREQWRRETLESFKRLALTDGLIDWTNSEAFRTALLENHNRIYQESQETS